MSLIPYKQHIFGRFRKEKEETRMVKEHNTFLFTQQHCTANVFYLCINSEGFADHLKIFSSCLFMQGRKEKFGNNCINYLK